LHVYIPLILVQFFKKKIQFFMAYMEMMKYPNDTIMIGIVLIVFLLFKKYNIQFSLFYVVHVWSHFSLKICINNYQRNIYMQEFFYIFLKL
jgi:hypothetical protein